MNFAVNTEEMRRCDKNTIEHFGIPAAVLMERAALAVAERIEYRRRTACGSRGCRVLIVAGCGNNGGDGLALGRILLQRGFEVSLYLVGETEKTSPQARAQLNILNAYAVAVEGFADDGAENVTGNGTREDAAVDATGGGLREDMATEDATGNGTREDAAAGGARYDIIVDALFGIGGSRVLTGKYAAAVNYINACKRRDPEGTWVVAIDMPSGVSTDDGRILGVAVRADETVTFNYAKLGALLYPGCDYAGELVIEDVGITQDSFLGQLPAVRYYTEPGERLLPARDGGGNKSTFGKVLVVAGNHLIGGACVLCAQSCYRSGAGMVRVFTAEENRDTLQTVLPEALLTLYDAADGAEENQERAAAALREACAWSSCAVMGPGIGTGAVAARLLEYMLTQYRHPLILDADALNLLAKTPRLLELAAAYTDERKYLILTPHLGEFARLWKAASPEGREEISTQEARAHILTWPKALAKRLHCTILCKDARSVTASADTEAVYLNLSGNDGMATAGSGDVLAGMVAAFAAGGMPAVQAASVGAYLHGLAGDAAAEAFGTHGMLAGDMLRLLRTGR